MSYPISVLLDSSTLSLHRHVSSAALLSLQQCVCVCDCDCVCWVWVWVWVWVWDWVWVWGRGRREKKKRKEKKKKRKEKKGGEEGERGEFRELLLRQAAASLQPSRLGSRARDLMRRRGEEEERRRGEEKGNRPEGAGGQGGRSPPWAHSAVSLLTALCAKKTT